MHRQSKRSSLLAGVLSVALLLPAVAWAQEGSIDGVVRDDTGGVLPGVTVEARSPALIEGVRRTVTDGEGRYRITALRIGVYEIRFVLDGFSPLTRENVQVSTGSASTVEVAMRVGGLDEEVTVVGEPPSVDVRTPGSRITITGDDIRELPTARNLSSLMVLVPGMQWQTGILGESDGICVGGAGTWCSPNIMGFNVNTDPPGGAFNSLSPYESNQGQLRVDGQLLNSAGGGIFGALSGYLVDVANAEEVSFNLTGALGESETGGASINIVPRTGGNTYRGNYTTSYTSQMWRDRNRGSRLGGTASNNVGIKSDHDVSGSFGGPILRDRLWFQTVIRTQGKEAFPSAGVFSHYYNKNAGIWGANYVPDRDRGVLTYTNRYTNANLRLTLQASARNKLNLFWDEQEACQDPCKGSVSARWSPEAQWSPRVSPNRLQQASWTNPFTNRLLFEGGVSVTSQTYDFTNHKYEHNFQENPTVSEAGRNDCCVGRDDVAAQVHTSISNQGAFGSPHTTGQCGGPVSPMCSGSIFSSTITRQGNARPRLSMSYITGSHNAKIGWEMQYFWQDQLGMVNQPLLKIDMTSPPETCNPADGHLTTGCGVPNVFMAETNNPGNVLRRPIPVSFTVHSGGRNFDERLHTQALFVQDQWTLNRVTFNGALRYDFATSRYLPTCQPANHHVSEEKAWCSPSNRGPRYHDITPRMGVAWDMFGDGRTALKFNLGRYHGAARFGGRYTDANLGRGSSSTPGNTPRPWADLNGDRRVDCDIFNPAQQNAGRDPALGDWCGSTNATNLANWATSPIHNFTGTFLCGRETVMEAARADNPDLVVPDFADQYCGIAGQNLYEGWGVREGEWQIGFGVQREILPRLSVEVSYDQRFFRNQTVTDQLQVMALDNPNAPYFGQTWGSGCNLYDLSGFTPLDANGNPTGTLNVFTGTTSGCQDGMLAFDHPHWSFYSVQAPRDSRLPGGGGYTIHGLAERNTVDSPTNLGSVQTLQNWSNGWRGINTNVVLRARGGLRISGGTNTGGSWSNSCRMGAFVNGLSGGSSNNASFTSRDSRPTCELSAPWRWNVRANASYTIPYVDVLASTVIQRRPGPSKSAIVTYRLHDGVPIPATALYNGEPGRPTIAWEPGSEWRATNTFGCVEPTQADPNPVMGRGCTWGMVTSETVAINMFRPGDAYWPSYYNVDLRLGKNVRFARRTLNIGVDVYNMFNSDAATSYSSTYNPQRWEDESGTYEANPWGEVTNILAPRFARFQVQFSF